MNAGVFFDDVAHACRNFNPFLHSRFNYQLLPVIARSGMSRNFIKVLFMSTPLLQGVAPAVYFSPQPQESKSPRTDAVSKQEEADVSAVEKMTGLNGLIAELAADGESPETMIDAVNVAFEKITVGLDQKIKDLESIQARRQAAMEDLNGLDGALQNYMAGRDKNASIDDLSEVKVPLSPNSPLRKEVGAGVDEVSVEKMMDYYRREHKELVLPPFPKTMAALEFCGDRLHQMVVRVLEPASQRDFVKLQELVSTKRSMQEAQAMIYRMITDAFKKVANAL